MVCPVTAPEVCVPLVPLHESPLEPETVQDDVLVELHVTFAVPLFATKVGRTEKVTVGGGGPTQTPLRQPYWQCWMNESLHEVFR